MNNWVVIILTANPKFYYYIKHIKIKYHFIQKKVKSKKIVISYISTKDMVANGSTKVLDSKLFKLFWNIIKYIKKKAIKWLCLNVESIIISCILLLI